jgi:transposase
VKAKYFLGLDVAKQKVRAALRGPGGGGLLWEKDLPVSAAGRDELLAQLQGRVPEGRQLLIVLEATGVLHLNWSAALAQAGYAVAVINPLIARRLYSVENALRDNKTDPIDARGLCEIGRLHGEKLVAKYRFRGEPERFALQRLQTVRKALRNSLTNLKKSYQSLLELSFPELGDLLELDGVGIRQLLAEAPTPEAIAQKRLATLEKNWMLRPKAARLKALAAHSMADPLLAQASAPALQLILQGLAKVEEKDNCGPSTNRSRRVSAKASIQKPRRSWKPSPALVPLWRPKSWPTCPRKSCTRARAGPLPPGSKPSWATTRGSKKAGNGKAKPR